MFDQAQWVCLVCGYNMVGEMPEVCPFCGARHDSFLTWEETERRFRVTPSRVNDSVMQLLSVPRLGLEHAAYRIETGGEAVWIDCPSAFNRDLAPVKAIYFTHRDFMGASNQYRAAWGAEVAIHARDAAHPLARPFPVDRRFEAGFHDGELEAIPIGGHTPGFTVYIFRDVLFVCDFAFPPGPEMRLNPYSTTEMRAKAEDLKALLARRAEGLKIVCGYNYVVAFEAWRSDFERMLATE